MEKSGGNGPDFSWLAEGAAQNYGERESEDRYKNPTPPGAEPVDAEDEDPNLQEDDLPKGGN